MTKRHVEIAIYALFIVAIMLAPLVLDYFWVNRLAKYLVFGMLGVAVSPCRGAMPASSISARACSSAAAPTCSPCR